MNNTELKLSGNKYQSFLKSVSNNTKFNNHTEARMLIASYFGFKNEIEKLRNINNIQTNQRFITTEQIASRSEITKRMINKIRFKHGSYISDEVNSHL